MIKTKDYIANSFVELCSNKDLSKLSVYDICKILSISRTTFYKNFDDKYDLINYIYVLDKNQAFSLERAHKSFRDAVICMFQLMKDKKEYYINVLTGEIELTFLNSVFFEIYNDYMQCAIQKETVVSEHNKNIIVFSAAGITNLFRKWIKEEMEKEPEQVVDEIYSILPDYMTSLDK